MPACRETKRENKEAERRQQVLCSFTVDLPNFHCAFLGLHYFTFLEFFSKLLNACENPPILSRPISNIPLALTLLLLALPDEITLFSEALQQVLSTILLTSCHDVCPHDCRHGSYSNKQGRPNQKSALTELPSKFGQDI